MYSQTRIELMTLYNFFKSRSPNENKDGNYKQAE